MTYAVSDLHGCYEKYRRLLETICLGEDDTLYVLGDVIDRGTGGIAILQDMMTRSNVVPLMGNHESMALPAMKEIRRGEQEPFSSRELWLINGGDTTEPAFLALSDSDRSQLIAYIESFCCYREITVAGKRYHLSHTLPEFDSYHPSHPLRDMEELLWGEPDYDTAYDDDVFFITGHTPTAMIDPDCAGRIYRNCGHIAIDCGAVFGYPLGCFCPDTQAEIYIP